MSQTQRTGLEVVVMARIQALPGRVQELMRAAELLVEASRKEAGCVSYDFHQSVMDSDSFVFYETWLDMAAFALHRKTDHIRVWREAVEGVAKGPPEVSVWKRLCANGCRQAMCDHGQN